MVASTVGSGVNTNRIVVVVGVIVPVMIAVVIKVGDGVSRGDGATGVSIGKGTDGGMGVSITGGGRKAMAVWVAAASMVRAKSVLAMSTVGAPKGDSG